MLAVPKTFLPIESLEDLANQDYYKYGTIDGAALSSLMAVSVNRTHSSVFIILVLPVVLIPSLPHIVLKEHAVQGESRVISRRRSRESEKQQQLHLFGGNNWGCTSRVHRL